jgi:8-oxo-dGTP pyrophosphatase MutT (NUDIX family)
VNLARIRRALEGHRPTTDDAPGAAPAAVTLLLVDAPAGPEVLLIRRAERAGDPWSGQIGLPGGKQDPRDFDLLRTAVRETREEVGVDLAAVPALAQLSDLRPRTPLLPPVYVRPFVFGVERRPELRFSAEVQEGRWVGLEALLQPGRRREVAAPVPGLERPMPAYVLDDWVVWGMTERILTPFLALVAPGV